MKRAWISNESTDRNISGKIPIHSAVFENPLRPTSSAETPARAGSAGKPQNPPWTEYVEASAYEEMKTRLDRVADYDALLVGLDLTILGKPEALDVVVRAISENSKLNQKIGEPQLPANKFDHDYFLKVIETW